jgi:predicted alpha/beta-hydrolase family hydrolase
MDLEGDARIAITVAAEQKVSGIWNRPDNAFACYVFAHGAGAGMQHSFMEAIATSLNARRIATLRYQFPYMEKGSKRPDAPKLAHATVRAAVTKAHELAPDLPLFAGGKSFGGRMTSQAQAESALEAARGLIFVGFPLHPASKPSKDRADHLAQIKIPMFFLQGTRDALAELSLIRDVVGSMAGRATLKIVENADHSFHVPARSGRKDSDVHQELTDAIVSWIKNLETPRKPISRPRQTKEV